MLFGIEYKYLVFFIVLIFGVPLGYFLSFQYRIFEKISFFLMIFFTAKMEDINFVSMEFYRGTSKGFEVGLVDLATLVIFLVLISRKSLHDLRLPKGTLLYSIYFFFSVLSIVNAPAPLYSMFEVWKMIRMYIFWWVLYNYIDDYSKFQELMINFAIISIFIFFMQMHQKYIFRIYQSPGPFPHQNSLVMYVIILNSFFFSYLFNAKVKRLHVWLLILGFGSVSIIATLSRAGMALYALSLVVMWTLSMFVGVNQKKIAITAVLLILASLALLKAMDSIITRYQTAPEASKTTRVLLAEAAVKMADDKKLGVGLNNFGQAINAPFNYGTHIQMHDETDPLERHGLVETIYLMIAAETGWHNLGVFLTFLLYMYFLNLKNLFKYRKTKYVFIPVALVGGLLAIYLESSLEWVLKQTNNFYQLMLVFAVIGAMHRLVYVEKKESVEIADSDETDRGMDYGR